MAANAKHSSTTAEHYTPSIIVEPSRSVLGRIDLDPASCEEANQIVNADRYFTKQDDGLKQIWSAGLGGYCRVFINPPGDPTGKLVQKFWVKLLYEYEIGRVHSAIWVGFNIGQFRSLQRPVGPMVFPFCVPDKRIKFIEGIEQPGPQEPLFDEDREEYIAKVGDNPTHDSFVALLPGSELQKHLFAYEFGKLGQVRL